MIHLHDYNHMTTPEGPQYFTLCGEEHRDAGAIVHSLNSAQREALCPDCREILERQVYLTPEPEPLEIEGQQPVQVFVTVYGAEVS